ncbi:MAG: hypothetical protein M3367_19705 [Acidobacteriota bacterium]|nr:hypothetical protein [Acidobacteriota bacterium]
MFSVLSLLSRPFRKRSTVAAQSAEARNSSKTPAEKPKFAGSPLFNVLLMVTLMLSVSAFFRFLEWRKFNAQTQIQFNDSDNPTSEEKSKNKNIAQSADIFGGEVAQTSRRLRETGAFGFAVCLSILDEAQKKRQIPGSINGLIQSVATRNLMPPGLSVENGEVRSQTSKIYIRYQPEPMQLEFVSLPTEARFGPALMLRFPLTSADGKNIAYFQSAKVENVNLPAPFAPAHEVIRSGWTLEAWRGMEIGGGNQDFARMLAEEQENLKSKAPASSGTRPR